MNKLSTLTTLVLICTGVSSACSQPRSSASREPPAQSDGGGREERDTSTDRERERGANSELLSPKKLRGYKTPGETLTIGSRHHPEGIVAVSLPTDYGAHPEKSWPLVIAFGGAGECAREPRSGALAWMDFYKADEAIIALKRGQLKAADFRGLTTPGQLREFNAKLRKSAFQGVILACPSSPLISREFPLDSSRYEAFVIDEVIPALQKTYRVLPGRIGVDGVSMGGARSMFYGLRHPETFASIGAVQGAFGRYFYVYQELIARNQSLLKDRPIQLVTSDGDGLAPAVTKLHSMLDGVGIPHRFLMLTGPHGYTFNQGPGSLSLLMFHDEVLWSGAVEGSVESVEIQADHPAIRELP